MNLYFNKNSCANIIFYTLLVVISLHIFRFSKLYLGLYAGLSLAIMVHFFFKIEQVRPKSIVGWVAFLYILASGGVAVVSAIFLESADFLMAASRFYFVYPLFFAALLCINLTTLRIAVRLYLIVVAAAALSLIYQVYFGPIPYFVEHSNRAGIPRYATFLGALPTFGVAGAFALLFIGFAVRNLFVFVALFFLIFTGLILTLQKAALANLLIVLIFIFWLSWAGKLSVNIKKLFSLVLIFSAINFYALNDYVLVNLDFLGVKLHRSNGDLIGWTGYGMGEDANMRLSNHFLQSHLSGSQTSVVETTPSQTLTLHFFGVGYQALGGALGLDKYPMSHNGVVDIWRLGGVPYTLVFLLLCLSIAHQLKFSKIQDDYYYYGVAFFSLFALNFVFYTGIFVNPSLAMLFWINLVYISTKQDVE